MIQGMNVIASTGSYFFILTPLLTFTIFLNELVREKELRLRQGLSVVGVSHSVYWISWLLVGIAFSALTSFALGVMGVIC